jgi:endonuclease III-like uncharacterized protein
MSKFKQLNAIENPDSLACMLSVEKVFQEKADSILTWICMQVMDVYVLFKVVGKDFQKNRI